MILVIDGHSYLYEMESLCDIFFPYEKVTAVYENGHEDSLLVYTGYKEENGGPLCRKTGHILFG